MPSSNMQINSTASLSFSVSLSGAIKVATSSKHRTTELQQPIDFRYQCALVHLCQTH